MQPLSARDLTAEHVGRRVKVGDLPVAVLTMVHGVLYSGMVTVWLAKVNSTRIPYTVEGSTRVLLDPPREVTGD